MGDRPDRRQAGSTRPCTRRLCARNTQGTIAEFLRTTSEQAAVDQAALQQRLKISEAQIKELEDQVDSAAEQERLDGALTLIGADMTHLARQLALEHTEDDGQVRLSLGKMTVTVETLEEETFTLRGIGGAGTRVGYPLAAYLAMHRL